MSNELKNSLDTLFLYEIKYIFIISTEKNTLVSMFDTFSFYNIISNLKPISNIDIYLNHRLTKSIHISLKYNLCYSNSYTQPLFTLIL
ncbi:hypothetical protein E1H24_09770 [Clostridioides difficile]|nr:hypothetical protein [Clostridioides difficile]OFU27167.1 hypothetical protein HMPREF3075_16200 [Clostridium sp. HMSC19B11]EGT4697967.1 hypothetical protein [Clostridioides difficile]EGT4825719.1 hypothetical protein [Clostridioides difficile]EGT5245566.1 hypothetical protein [Clostridioides difficile]